MARVRGSVSTLAWRKAADAGASLAIENLNLAAMH